MLNYYLKKIIKNNWRSNNKIIIFVIIKRDKRILLRYYIIDIISIFTQSQTIIKKNIFRVLIGL